MLALPVCKAICRFSLPLDVVRTKLLSRHAATVADAAECRMFGLGGSKICLFSKQRLCAPQTYHDIMITMDGGEGEENWIHLVVFIMCMQLLFFVLASAPREGE